MKKIIYGVLFLALLGIIVVGCQKENLSNSNGLPQKIKEISTQGVIAFNAEAKKFNVVDETEIDLNSDVEYHVVKHVVTFNEELIFSSKEELKELLKNNIDKINGNYEIFVDEKISYSVQIENGEMYNEQIYSEFDDAVEVSCSYQSIRKCAIDRIHKQNWYNMILCIEEGFGCVVHYYIECTVDLC